jgi:hypothetical protein
MFKTISGKELGVDFKNEVVETNDLNILDYIYFYNGGGTAIGDINNDGLPDVFLAGNQVENKLYLNKGGLNFEDISATAKIEGSSSWNTGAVMGDVNGDGLLDVYVCAVVGINNFQGKNELYINNGDLTFTESASKYNLDIQSFGTSAAFLDFDLDGDLDIYLLNHAIHTSESFGKTKGKRNSSSGDRLMRNDGHIFTDVSEEAGIYGNVSGYGLGVAVSDFNKDGFPDIYVGNDFHEDDYYYINNGDGTFSDKLEEYFGHISRFSMGNDVADINNDGWQDIISLDMSPEDEKVLKSSAGDDNIQTQKMRTEWYGYHYQFARNMLFVNQQGKDYKETALLSGVSSTDWSWSALFGDYDQDGIQDLFISNGIPKRPNNLDFIKYISNEGISIGADKSKVADHKTLEMMPSGKIHNYVYQGNTNLKFADKSGDWIKKDSFVSGATAYGDLDNDGDLDIVVNNFNDEVAFYINQTNNTANYLKLNFNYSKSNTFGIGTKVYTYSKNALQYKELYSSRGFQASSEPMIHFGFGEEDKIDSIKIIWPNNKLQIIKDIALNQSLTIEFDPSAQFVVESGSESNNEKILFEKTDDNLGISMHHLEDDYVDFNRQKLIPFQISDRGPATAIGDLNNDEKPDIFFGGSKRISSKVYFQNDEGFSEASINTIVQDSIKEEVTALIADFNGDSKDDLYVGSGGGDFYNQSKPLKDTYFSQNSKRFTTNILPEFYSNTSVVKEADFDNDGDLDLFIGNQAVSNNYGALPTSYLLINENGKFSDAKLDFLSDIGMVTDAVWDDFNKDGLLDLVVVGEWMQPRFFKNVDGSLQEENLVENLNGLWQSIIPFDIDEDGDTDYLMGNWGLNSKFKASEEQPMIMYYDDFDNNGSTETIVCTSKNGNYYPLMGLDKLSGQMEFLRRSFTTYESFAGKNIESVLGSERLEKAKKRIVHTLSSGYLKNNGSSFEFVEFPNKFQVAPITTLVTYDFDNDEKEEVLLAGNYFGVTPFHGRFGSFSGGFIKNDELMILSNQIGLNLFNKAVRDLNVIEFKEEPYLLVTVNNGRAEVYKISSYK